MIAEMAAHHDGCRGFITILFLCSSPELVVHGFEIFTNLATSILIPAHDQNRPVGGVKRRRVEVCILLNLLTDKCTVPEGSIFQLIPPSLSFDSVLDFILIGMISMVVDRNCVNRNQLWRAPDHTTCQLQRAIPDIDKSLLYVVAFVDLMASLWLDESRCRNCATWSPMPWSRTSAQEPLVMQSEGGLH